MPAGISPEPTQAIDALLLASHSRTAAPGGRGRARGEPGCARRRLHWAERNWGHVESALAPGDHAAGERRDGGGVSGDEVLPGGECGLECLFEERQCRVEIPRSPAAAQWTREGGASLAQACRRLGAKQQHPDRAFHDELATAYADLGRADEAAEQQRLSTLAGPGQFALWQSRPRSPRSDPGS